MAQPSAADQAVSMTAEVLVMSHMDCMHQKNACTSLDLENETIDISDMNSQQEDVQKPLPYFFTCPYSRLRPSSFIAVK